MSASVGTATDELSARLASALWDEPGWGDILSVVPIEIDEREFSF
jgi:hypothetical protein